MVGGASVHTSKHSLSRLKITVGCRLCWCCVDMCGVRMVCGGVWCMCMCVYVYVYVYVRGVYVYVSCRVLCVCVEMVVVYVLRVCVGCAFCVLCVVVSLCVVLVLVVVCNVWCAECEGACVGLCVVSVVCCVWCVCVARLGTRKTPSGVYRQNARMLNTFSRFAFIHVCVLNLHTETF